MWNDRIFDKLADTADDAIMGGIDANTFRKMVAAAWDYALMEKRKVDAYTFGDNT